MLTRLLRYGNGWYGFFTDVAATRRSIGWIDEFAAAGLRPPELGRAQISVTPPPGPVTRETIERYAETGVDRVIPIIPTAQLDETLRFVEQLGRLAEG